MQQTLPTAMSQVPQASVYGVGGVNQSGMYGGVQASGVQQPYQSGQPMFSNGAAYQQSLQQAMGQDQMHPHAVASIDPQQPTGFAHMPPHMVPQMQTMGQMPGHLQMHGQMDTAHMGQALSALHASQQLTQQSMMAPAMAHTMPHAMPAATTPAMAPAAYEPPGAGDANEDNVLDEGSNKKPRIDAGEAGY
jgi:hypothetical protein